MPQRVIDAQCLPTRIDVGGLALASLVVALLWESGRYAAAFIVIGVMIARTAYQIYVMGNEERVDIFATEIQPGEHRP